jgi:hypothetical protein
MNQKERGLKMAYMALNNPESKTGDIRQDLSPEKLESFARDVCKPNSIIAAIPFVDKTLYANPPLTRKEWEEGIKS